MILLILFDQISMNAMKELIDVTRTVITLLVHMLVAVTMAISLMKMESVAMVNTSPVININKRA